MSTRFEDDTDATDIWTKTQFCQHAEHNPPGMIAIPPGKKMIHTCPGCGKVTTVRSPAIRC